MPRPRQEKLAFSFEETGGEGLPKETLEVSRPLKELRETGTHPYMRALRKLLEEKAKDYVRVSENGDFLNLSDVNFDEASELSSLLEHKNQRALTNLVHAAQKQGYIEFVNRQGNKVVVHPAEMPKRVKILVTIEQSLESIKLKDESSTRH